MQACRFGVELQLLHTEVPCPRVYLFISMYLWLFLIQIQQCAPRDLSDFKEALPQEDVWRSATTMSGAQCAMMPGVLLMLRWPADSWDSLPLVPKLWPLVLFLMALVRSGWTMSTVLELRPDSLTALLIHWGPTTVCMLKMLEWTACQVHLKHLHTLVTSSTHILDTTNTPRMHGSFKTEDPSHSWGFVDQHVLACMLFVSLKKVKAFLSRRTMHQNPGLYAAPSKGGFFFTKGGFYFQLNGCGLHMYHINSCV